MIHILKRLAIFLVAFSIVNILLGIISSYFIIYSDSNVTMLSLGTLSFALYTGLLVFLFFKIILIISEQGYLGKPQYFKIFAICLVLGIIAGVLLGVFRLGVTYVFSDYYIGLTKQMQSSLIELYTKAGLDVVALKQGFYDERFYTWGKLFFTDLKITFSFSVVAGLLTPLIIRKKLKAINYPD